MTHTPPRISPDHTPARIALTHTECAGSPGTEAAGDGGVSSKLDSRSGALNELAAAAVLFGEVTP